MKSWLKIPSFTSRSFSSYTLARGQVCTSSPSFLLQDLALALEHDLIDLTHDLFGVVPLIFWYFLDYVKLFHGAELLL